ncbi:hypothetical protein [Novosphingobium aquimarinum]|uniref:hypothetical protein n=1 Tax=Novosphingobium aquimarinum TaxID=2682494 RepID=UPI0012EB0BF0|nr:hypothetical protein [Novosphingobium aquimarinum]
MSDEDVSDAHLGLGKSRKPATDDRNYALDVMKGLLVAGMVLAHTIQFLNGRDSSLLRLGSHFINLVSFSGFLFCFGYACWIAYFSRARLPTSRILSTALKCYGAFVVSGLALLVLLRNEPLSLQLVWSVVLVRNLPAYSEFLLAFALVILIAALCAKAVRYLANNLTLLLGFSIAMLVLAWFVPDAPSVDPVVGALIGGGDFSYFPALTYSPIFLAGAYLAAKPAVPTRWIVGIGLATFSLFVLAWIAGFGVERFPPEPIWIVSSFGASLLYFVLSGWLVKTLPMAASNVLIAIGQNSLGYLVLSNLTLFVVAQSYARSLSWQNTLIAYALVMALIRFVLWITVQPKTRRKVVL